MSYRYLSIEEVLSEIRIDADNEDSRDDLVFRQWIFRALRQIGYAKNQRKTSPLIAVEDFSFRVPCDLAEPIQLNLLNSSGGALLFHWSDGKGFTGVHHCHLSVSEREDSEMMDLSTNATGICWAEMDYWAMPVDDNGQPLTAEIFLEAVMAFVEWRWTKRQRKRKPKEVSNADVASAKADWTILSQQAHGRSKMPNQMEAEHISRGNISRIPNMGRRPISFRN